MIKSERLRLYDKSQLQLTGIMELSIIIQLQTL